MSAHFATQNSPLFWIKYTSHSYHARKLHLSLLCSALLFTSLLGPPKASPVYKGSSRKHFQDLQDQARGLPSSDETEEKPEMKQQDELRDCGISGRHWNSIVSGAKGGFMGQSLACSHKTNENSILTMYFPLSWGREMMKVSHQCPRSYLLPLAATCWSCALPRAKKGKAILTWAHSWGKRSFCLI